MGALTHNGEVLQSLPANASQINFDKTGTNLNSTQTENAIKEVNTKVNNLGYCNVLNAQPLYLAGSTDLNTVTDVGVYGGHLYPSNLGHSPEPSNANASRVKLLVSQTGSSSTNSLEQQITIINDVSGANNTYKRQFLNNTWSEWTSYDKDIDQLKSGLMSQPTDAVKNADYIGTNLLKVIRIGNLVNVSGRFQVETEKPAGYVNYLFSNLPIPAGDTVGVHSNTFDNVRLYINASGYLTCNDVAPVGYYNVSATYAVTN